MIDTQWVLTDVEKTVFGRMSAEMIDNCYLGTRMLRRSMVQVRILITNYS
jgi:hypothetical protein